MKSSDSISLDSAQWYLEALINFEKAYNDHQLINLEFFKDSLPVITENGLISNEQMELAYSYFSQKIVEALALKNDPSYLVDMIDLKIKDDQNVNSEDKIIEMNASLGFHYIGNFIAFEFDDYWRWCWNLGKCRAYFGSGDAADELEYRFNHPAYVLMPGYFLLDVEMISTYLFEYPDPNNPGPYGDYMTFYASGPGENPAEEPCLSPTELNYYLTKFDYIMNLNKPAGKTFKSVDVVDDFMPAMNQWRRFHTYQLYYATYIYYSGGE